MKWFRNMLKEMVEVLKYEWKIGNNTAFILCGSLSLFLAGVLLGVILTDPSLTFKAATRNGTCNCHHSTPTPR